MTFGDVIMSIGCGVMATIILLSLLYGTAYNEAMPPNPDANISCSVMFENGTIISGGGNNICVKVIDNNTTNHK